MRPLNCPTFAMLLMTAVVGHGATLDNSPDFTREIRPLLSRLCFKCHGPDEATRKAKLRLDVRTEALQPAKSGEIAIVPGQPDRSELVKRIFSMDADDVMPPPSTKVQVKASEKDLIRRWIAGGAEYRDHWAFGSPQRPPLAERAGSPENPIDVIVGMRLEKEGLRFSPTAEPHTLVRRLYFDLIGLPPTPEEAEAFVSDGAADAYERLVDRLLASPHYGERWARRWMDLARYADSNGYEKDRPRSIWAWRDWVIQALNADMPFDQFTIEQIAGDLLPNATLSQRIATGFHRNTMLNEEGGIDPLEFRFHAMTDRVGTTGTTWLGLTLGCAQCHTHKYDPIPHREYFQVMAFLNNADEVELDLTDLATDEQYRKNQQKAARLMARLAEEFPVESNSWQTLTPATVRAESGQLAKVLDDGSVLFSGESADKDTYTLVVDTVSEDFSLLRLETLTHEKLPSKGPGRVAHGNFVLTELSIAAAPRNAPEQAQPLKLASATAEMEQNGFPAHHAIDGNNTTGWAVDADRKKLNANHSAVFTLAEPAKFSGGARLVIRMDQQYGGQHTIGRFRLGVGRPAPSDGPIEVRRRELVDKRFKEWLQRERSKTVAWTPLRPVRAKSNSPLLTVQADDSVLASGDITKSDLYELEFKPVMRGITAIRLEALPEASLPGHGPGMTYYEGPKGDFFMGEFQVLVDGNPTKVARASHSYAKNNFGSSASASLAIDGDPQTGWSTAGREGERHEAVFVFAEPLSEPALLQVKMLFGRHYACSLGRFRISVTTHAGGGEARDVPAEVQALLSQPEGKLTGDHWQALFEQFLLGAPELASASKEIQRLRKPPALPTTLVLQERPPENPRPTFVHKRGEYLQTLDPVEPGVLSAVAPFPKDWPRNRLGFARWLVSTNNPLTARVTVNRQWEAFFGHGLVRTTGDFGFQGEAPTHPELLDWLAVEFMKQGWSLKKLHRQIVMSRTYRQTSRATAELRARDPDNRLLARGPNVRLEAEMIRDAALRASGLLSTKAGGPSVYPPQPEGVTEVAYGGSKWTASSGEDRHRRSIYTFMKRTAPFALFNTFDGPTGEACVARRDVSNTPLQALTLLNDVVFIEAAQALGRLLVAREEPVESSVQWVFRRCLTRPPTEAEVAALVEFFNDQKRRFDAKEVDAAAVAGDGPGNVNERAAWTVLARAILNLDEVITKG